VRPTFGDDFDVTVETLILDFDDDIYGEDLQVEFIRWLRPEEKFASVQELVDQIEEDKTVTRRIFENGFE
jgi:riboflavin kinase/FMN adenylyltransferase